VRGVVLEASDSRGIFPFQQVAGRRVGEPRRRRRIAGADQPPLEQMAVRIVDASLRQAAWQHPLDPTVQSIAQPERLPHGIGDDGRAVLVEIEFRAELSENDGLADPAERDGMLDAQRIAEIGKHPARAVAL
jgi:hypothetical protein